MKYTKFIITLFFCLTGYNSNADQFFLNNATGSSNTELTTSLKALITNSIVSEGHQVVNSPAQANALLSPSIMKLGNSYIVTLSKTINGQVVNSQKMKALTLDELDLISSRLTKAVINNQSVESTQTVDSVSQKEERGTSVVRKAKKQFYLGFGPGRVTNLNTNEMGFAYTLGFLFGLDHQFSLRAALEGVTVSSSNADQFEFGLGGQYYLNKNNMSPYLVGALTYGRAETHIEEDECVNIFITKICNGEKKNGFGAKLGVGMHFYRSTSVNFAVEASHSQNMFNINGKYPGMTSLKILVLY